MIVMLYIACTYINACHTFVYIRAWNSAPYIVPCISVYVSLHTGRHYLPICLIVLTYPNANDGNVQKLRRIVRYSSVICCLSHAPFV